MKQQLAEIAFLTPDAEASTLRFPLAVFFVWVNRTQSVSGSAVLHWYRRCVIAKLSVRHSAAVDLERSESVEKTWTTVPCTWRTKTEDTNHQELARALVVLGVASM